MKSECVKCSSPLEQPTTGRPRLYCGTACRRSAEMELRRLQQALPPRFQPNASWLMHLASTNWARTIPAGSGLTEPMLSDATTPPRMLGKPAYEASPMDDTVTASAADYLAIYGDIRQAYVVADRIGTTIELVPHLFGSNRRPTGQRGWFMYRRVGGNLVNASASRLLNKSA